MSTLNSITHWMKYALKKLRMLSIKIKRRKKRGEAGTFNKKNIT